MPAPIHGDEPPLVETNHVADVFATGIGRIERVGPSCARLTLVCDATDGFGRPERLVVARVIVQIAGIPETLAAVSEWLACQTREAVVEGVTRLLS
jgi:hypothetical protein